MTKEKHERDKKSHMNQIYVMPCESQEIVRSPFYKYVRHLFGRRQYLNSLIHHVCSIIGHAKSRTR